MSRGRKALHARRAALLARSAAQRDQVFRSLEAFRRPLAWVDGGLSLLRGARRHAPTLGAGLGVGLAALLLPGTRGMALGLARSVGTLIAKLRERRGGRAQNL